MTTATIKLQLRQVQDLKELQIRQDGKWVRRIGLVYFQAMEDGYVPRVISEATNGDWIKQMIKERRIYVTAEAIKAELG